MRKCFKAVALNGGCLGGGFQGSRLERGGVCVRGFKVLAMNGEVFGWMLSRLWP